jgi:arylsulfatase A-like enzyme/Flp pilus assembly protein TadD
MTRRRAAQPAKPTRKPPTEPNRTADALHPSRRNRTAFVYLATGILLCAIILIVVRTRPGGGGSDRPQNVLLITLDTVRADRIGVYGYASGRTPNLDALARAGVRFTDATAPAPITGPAHAGILTGQYPARLGVRDNVSTPLPTHAVTLAETLAGRAYATGGFVGAFLLDRPYGFAKGFDTFESGFTRVESGREANAERRGDAVVDDALRWIAALEGGRRFFAWVHLYDPHSAYAPPEPFASQFAERPYDGEIAFVDHQIGRLLDALRARGVLDRTLVMAIADHGESLGQHGEDEHGVFLYEGVLRIPWIASGPGVARGRVVEQQVRAIDLFPTVLDLLGIAVHGQVDGESLATLLRGETRAREPASYSETYYPRLHYGWSELRSLRADGWKAIDAPRPELYNLREDPDERHNLYEQQRTLADRMIAEASRVEREMGGGAPVVVKTPDPETLERLRSLGYIGVTAALPQGARGPDPKDTIAERREYKVLISEAIDDLRGRRPADAIARLKRLVVINERAYDLHQLLGQAYQQAGKPNEALGEYELAALLNADAAAPLLSASEMHLALGDTAAARKRLEQAARLDPTSFDVAMISGLVLQQEERLPEALAAFEKATALNGANPRPRMLLASLATRVKRYDLAEAQLRRLLEMGYQPSRTHFALGRVAELRGSRDEAGDHYRQALALEPGLAMAEEGLRRLHGR